MKPESKASSLLYREAIRLKPDYAEAHNNLGIALMAQGKHDEAIVAYREAIRLKPDLGHDGDLALAAPLVRGPTPSPRLEHARKAVELAPKSGFSQVSLAFVEYRAGTWDTAVAATDSSASTVPGGSCRIGFVPPRNGPLAAGRGGGGRHGVRQGGGLDPRETQGQSRRCRTSRPRRTTSAKLNQHRRDNHHRPTTAAGTPR